MKGVKRGKQTSHNSVTLSGSALLHKQCEWAQKKCALRGFDQEFETGVTPNKNVESEMHWGSGRERYASHSQMIRL
jgi:hypothetical protein